MNITRSSNATLATRLQGALVALAIVTLHVADQGGVSNFTQPDWLGWSYRLIEVGGLLTAVTLLLVGNLWISWIPAALLAAAPFLGYVASRTVGVPQDAGDKGNWDDFVGTTALIVEAGLFVLALSILLAKTLPRTSTDSATRTLASSAS